MWINNKKLQIINRVLLISLLVSIIAHSFIFYSLNIKTNRTNNKTKQASYEGKKVKVTPSTQITEVSIVKLKKQKSEVLIKKEKEQKEKDCPDKWYGGIGINMMVLPDGGKRIIEIYPGYAAEKAGLQVGDVILFPSAGKILGEPNTPLTIRILRQNEIITINLIRSKVCYE